MIDIKEFAAGVILHLILVNFFQYRHDVFASIVDKWDDDLGKHDNVLTIQ